MMTLLRLLITPMVIAMAASAAAQAPPPAADVSPQVEPSLLSYPLSMPQILPMEYSAPPGRGDRAQQLLTFKDSDIKFRLQALMDILRDHRHEGWVLAAYPDPKTNRPLIGAGFSLDVQAVEHPQRDPLNPHPFVEPSSAQLWQAAGLPPDRLQQILDRFARDLTAWTAKKYRRKAIRQTLTPQLSDEEATRLLRISTIQAIYNAKAYCRGFDQLSAPQQMALSQLVFQMGVNLEEFVDFLGALNDLSGARELPLLDGYIENDAEHWNTVQRTLIDSQWARRYTVRATTVIAMFDPDYIQEPAAAQQRVEAVLRPPVTHRRSRRSSATLRSASYSKHSAHGKGGHSRVKRKTT